MRKNDLFCEIINSQSKHSINDCRLEGNIKLLYDIPSKAYLLNLNSASIAIPKHKKLSLDIVKPILLIQAYFFPKTPLIIEITIADSENNKRRLIFDKTNKMIKNSMYARIQNKVIFRGIWLNLCLDLNSLFSMCFSLSNFHSLDMVYIFGTGHIRKIISFIGPANEYLSKVIEPTSIPFTFQDLNKNSFPKPIAYSSSPVRIKDNTPSPNKNIFKKTESKYLDLNVIKIPSKKNNESKYVLSSPQLLPVKGKDISDSPYNYQHSSSLANNRKIKKQKILKFASVRENIEKAGFPNFFQNQSSLICSIRPFTPPFIDYNPIKRQYDERL